MKNLLQFAGKLNILAGVHSPRDPFTICKWKDFPFERNTDVTKGVTNFTASFYSMNFAKTLRINDITSVLRSAPAAAFGGTLFLKRLWLYLGCVEKTAGKEHGQLDGELLLSSHVRWESWPTVVCVLLSDGADQHRARGEASRGLWCFPSRRYRAENLRKTQIKEKSTHAHKGRDGRHVLPVVLRAFFHTRP